MTTGPTDDQGTPTPPEDTTQAYARRVWRDVAALLLASGVVGVAVIALLLLGGYRLAGLAGLIAGGVVTVVGILLVARKLLTY